MLDTLGRLEEVAAGLRSGALDLVDYLDAACDRIDALDLEIEALLPEPGRRARLRLEAEALAARYPEPLERPVMYGVPVGVKDIFRVDGFPTRAGSRLPPELFVGPEASSVTALRRAGALVLGKTVTTEFAYFAPGPTRNPRRPTHSPGGSSSGSAAAVAAGFCPLALGTQTIGSVIRPAAFCGVVGFKPTFGRIPIDGVVPCSLSLDHVGVFTATAGGLSFAAAVLCRDWSPELVDAWSEPPAVGVPDGPYLAQASVEAQAEFERQVAQLEAAGVRVRRVPALGEIEAINRRHVRLMAAEMAGVHSDWFAEYEPLYQARTAGLIREGQIVTDEELDSARAGQSALRHELEALMADAGISAWVCPAAIGPAPEGIESTGSPLMNLPWTHAGMPAVTLPMGAVDGLPLGLQIVAAAMADEWLVGFAAGLERRLRGA